MNRRDFLQFLGVSGVLANVPLCAREISQPLRWSVSQFLPPSLEDRLITAEGLSYRLLIKWGDPINALEKFGFNNDFISFHPLSLDRGLLWVNHETVSPMFINGPKRTKENVDLEMKEVGGSILEIQKVNGSWEVNKNSKFNRRLDAMTEIPMAWKQPIAGAQVATGTMANCAGGKTPWGTFLSCEENFEFFWGDVDRKNNRTPSHYMKWETFYPRPPQHYGWVVEIEPLSGKAKKLISLGRFCHECAAVTKSKNGKAVVYSGDDGNNQHLYKFISDSSDSLEQGKLYVANLEKGTWLSLDINDSAILKENFKDQTEIQTYTREAAKLLGATQLARPEDIEFDPLTGNVFIALTNNTSTGNHYGSILKIAEDGNDPGSLTFKHDTFLTGGKEAGFACPDNMAFDKMGNLWFTTDIFGRDINHGAYEGLGNNGLFVFLRSGAHAGEILRLATAPVDAEFTGPCFSPDYKTLFLSVQHPGEMSPDPKHLTSRWPLGDIPRSSVVTLEGPLLDKITKGKM
jgi:secreted PhoX family phosphatase